MASSPEAVKEMLIQKSGDYAGRQSSSTIDARTLGKTGPAQKLFELGGGRGA